MFAQRYSLVHQRLLQQDVFRPKLVSGAIASGGQTADPTVVLTPIESLLGRAGIRTLLGTIVQVRWITSSTDWSSRFSELAVIYK